MKKFLTLALGFGFLAPLYAVNSVVLQHHNFVDITVDEPAIEIQIGYPGMQGKACGIALRSSRSYGTSAGLQPLSDVIEVTTGFRPEEATVSNPEPTGQGMRYDIAKSELQKYLTIIRLKTKTGESLESAIHRTLPKTISTEPEVRVIAELVDCQQK